MRTAKSGTAAEKALAGAAAAPALIEALQHDDYAVRGAVAYLLNQELPGLVNEYPCLPDLLARRSRRLRAAGALPPNGANASGAVLAVLEALKDRDKYTCSTTLCHLQSFPAEVRFALPALIQAVNDPHFPATRELIDSLAELGPEGRAAVPALAFHLQRNPHDTAAADALVKIGAPAVPGLIELVKQSGDHQEAAIQALGRIGRPARDAVPLLSALVRRGRLSLRCHAACSLGQIGPDAQAAVPALTSALQDPNSQAPF